MRTFYDQLAGIAAGSVEGYVDQVQTIAPEATCYRVLDGSGADLSLLVVSLGGESWLVDPLARPVSRIYGSPKTNTGSVRRLNAGLWDLELLSKVTGPHHKIQPPADHWTLGQKVRHLLSGWARDWATARLQPIATNAPVQV